MAGRTRLASPRLFADEKTDRTRLRGDGRRALRDIYAVLIKAVVIVFVGWILLGVVFGFKVMEGEDMYPRIRDGDLMVIYRLEQDYAVGDVVTFAENGVQRTGRIVAQGGDDVSLSDDGELLVNGSVQSEQIFYPTEPQGDSSVLPCEVPAGSVFLLGDFRTNAIDSRTYGPVRIDELDGKVITILRRRGI